MSNRSDTNKNNSEYTGLSRLSIEELENLLEMADFSTHADAVDTDYILRILEVMEKREKENPNGSTLPDTAEAWNSFRKNYLPLAVERESLYPAEEEKRRFFLRPIYTAAVIVIVLLTGTLTAQALGHDVWNAIAQWGKDIFQFTPGTAPSQEEGKDSEPSNLEYDTLEKTLSAFGIKGVAIVPSWIPERFETPEIEVTHNPYSTMIAAVYTNADDVLVISLASIAGNATTSYEKDESEIILYNHSGITHYIMSNNMQYSAVWLSGIYECTIYGTVSEEELKQIIDSIYEKG